MKPTDFLPLVILLCAPLAGAQETLSPVNGRRLEPLQASISYSFLMGGHLYGAPLSHSIFPAATVLGSIDQINATGAAFFVALGDGYRVPSPLHIQNFRRAFIQKLSLPAFIAVGNHESPDATSRALYEGAFGETFYRFRYGHEIYVILDSELSGGRIEGDQLQFLATLVQNVVGDPTIRSVFLFSHRLIWAVDDPYFQPVFDQLNSSEGYDTGSYSRDVAPLVRKVAYQKDVYWCSGDIGVQHSLFFDSTHTEGVTYVATGIADTDRDALVHVRIAGDSREVGFSPVYLGSHRSDPLSGLDIEYWSTMNPPARSRLAKLWARLWVAGSHRYYLLGVVTSATVLALAAWWRHTNRGNRG
jgi:hypothetical protein